jgi:threonine dehydratase
VICVSEDVPHNRIKKIQYYGGEVIIHGKSQDDAFAKLQQLQQKCGYTLIHPFDDIDVIAGQGTIGIELIEDVPQLEMVLVPLSGGGLISGIAAAVKAYNPNIKVFGVSQERSPVMYKSIQRGYPIEMEEEETLADSLRGGIGLQNRYTFKLVNKLVDDIILVNEAEIAMGMHFLFTEHNMVIEGAGAVGISALLSNKVKMDCKNIAVIISGNTIETEDFLKAVKHHL